MSEPCSFLRWPGPTSSHELICPQFEWCSQGKGQGWTRSCHGTMSGQGLAPGYPQLHVILTVNNKFVSALNRSRCKLLEELLPAPFSSSRQDGSEGWELLLCLPLSSMPSCEAPGSSPSGQDQGNDSENQAQTWHWDAARIHSYQQCSAYTQASWVLIQLDCSALPSARPPHHHAAKRTGACSQRHPPHLGSLAPDPQFSGRRGGVTSQKQEAVEQNSSCHGAFWGVEPGCRGMATAPPCRLP